MLLFIPNGDDIGKFIQRINGGSSFILNKQEGTRQRVWGNYWSQRVVDTIMFENIYGYIIGNLLKHKEIGSFEELYMSVFSSYSQSVDKYSKDQVKFWVNNIIGLDFEYKKLFEKHFSK